ncbi:MAG: hypothetical protein LCH58_15905 [Bacteroidetes bacterium]|nr:hypothetical protein [Bacteroidota bacterium]
MAWHYTRYDQNVAWAKLELAARTAWVGLWADKQPVAPWEWRYMQKGDGMMQLY